MTHRANEPALMALKLDGIGPLGQTTAEHQGVRVFAFGGIPGEEVRAEVVRQRRKYIAARVAEVATPSPHRIDAPCPYFGLCTGCQWQHIRYEHQLELKRSIVREALEGFGGISKPPVSPVVPAPQPLGYRNHGRFTVGPGGALGFVNWQNRRFVSVNRCLLMHPRINEALYHLHGHCGETTQLSIRYGVNTGTFLIQPALKRLQLPLKTGQRYYEEALRGRRFRVSAPSFFQVNTMQAERMAWLVQERLALTGQELVVDAYAGVGTFAVLLAPFASKVIAIEDSASAVQDAQANIEGVPNVELAQARTEEMLGSLPRAPDALVLDPPRAGCHPRALHTLLANPPRRIVYVSCDPYALARDLRVLLRGPFTLEEVQPIDLFPQTHHIECLATLSYGPDRDKTFRSRQELILASESPRRQTIMTRMGLTFRVVPSEAEARVPSSTDVVSLARERATHKARAAASTLSGGTVIAADTIVADETGVMGKPASKEEAFAFLRRLRGRDHWVVTGLAVIDAASREEITGHRSSRVRMREYTDEEIAAYVATGDCMDKAGAYAIQDETFHPAARVTGCYLNVMGLPVCTLMRLLRRMGLYPTLDPNWVPPGQCPDCNRLAKRTAQG
jgi:23S rRNA (uracil1939-C5)-methyltransferase